MAIWLALVALLAGSVVMAEDAPDGPSIRWTFDADDEGWRVGASPTRFYTEGDGTEAAQAPAVAQGVVAVRGVPTERLFMDESGLVRRGATVMQWLLSPELGIEAAEYTRLAVRLRVGEGTIVNWRVQWLTESGRAAYGAHRSAGSRLALPDSVVAALDAYRRGEMPGEAWQRFMGEWEGGEGLDYSQAAKRLREEEILLRGWTETEEWRLTGSREWHDTVVDLGALPGWRGQVIALGLELILQPSAPEALGGSVHPAQEPFVWVDQVDLHGALAPQGLTARGAED